MSPLTHLIVCDTCRICVLAYEAARHHTIPVGSESYVVRVPSSAVGPRAYSVEVHCGNCHKTSGGVPFSTLAGKDSLIEYLQEQRDYNFTPYALVKLATIHLCSRLYFEDLRKVFGTAPTTTPSKIKS